MSVMERYEFFGGSLCGDGVLLRTPATLHAHPLFRREHDQGEGAGAETCVHVATEVYERGAGLTMHLQDRINY